MMSLSLLAGRTATLYGLLFFDFILNNKNSVSNRFDIGQDGRSVGSDLSPNCMQMWNLNGVARTLKRLRTSTGD